MMKTAMLKRRNISFVWDIRLGPLSHIAVETEFFFLMPAESARWEHICKPLDSNVVPSEPASYNEFIGLKQTEEECLCLAFISCVKSTLDAERPFHCFFL